MDDSWETCVSTGIVLAQNLDAGRFQMGDLGAVVATRYGDQSLAKFSAEIGLPRVNTLRQYVRVARAYEPGIRIQYLDAGLNWSHFRIALADPDRAEYWLAKAADDSLPVAALARAIKEATGKPVPPKLLYSGRGMIEDPTGEQYVVVLKGTAEEQLSPGLIVMVKVYESAGQE
jgi:hypothetical protein